MKKLLTNKVVLTVLVISAVVASALAQQPWK